MRRVAWTVLVALVITAGHARAQEVWTGPPITFTKADNADWTLEENQDRMTAGTWITRANQAGIFNIAVEELYQPGSPANTEWAFGSAADWPNLVFEPWQVWNNSFPPAMIDQDAVVHLIAEDVYIDIRFTSWTCCGLGGGFSYERSTPAGDLDSDGKIGKTDLLALIMAWGPCGDCAACVGDLDGDCVVGINDLLILLGNWT